MTFPQPAGYYSLKLSESAEDLITSFDYTTTLNLLYDVVVCKASDNIDRFYGMSTSLPKWFEDEIDELKRADTISLIRWLGDRLAFLHTVPVQEVK